jgi:hypothetical protein
VIESGDPARCATVFLSPTAAANNSHRTVMMIELKENSVQYSANPKAESAKRLSPAVG